MSLISETLEIHHIKFNSRTRPHLFQAPGRVNLIGEHTDYNDGFVFPAAIDKGICLALYKKPDNIMA